MGSGKRVVYAVVLVCICSVGQHLDMSDSEKSQYEKLGLSQVEWQMIKEAEMPIDKVKELISAGISIVQYFEYPWLSLGLSESEWIKRRSLGQVDEHMSTAATPGSQMMWLPVKSFFMPGVHQLRRKQPAKGLSMIAIFLGSLTLYALHGRSENESTLKFDYHFPYAVFLLGDMAWSALDMGYQVNKEINADAEHFSRLRVPPELRLTFSKEF